jgi:hypothetical protein
LTFSFLKGLVVFIVGRAGLNTMNKNQKNIPTTSANVSAADDNIVAIT